MRVPASSRAIAPLVILAVIIGVALVGLVGCAPACPEGQHQHLAGYTQHWVPGNGKTTFGHYSSYPNYVCVVNR